MIKGIGASPGISIGKALVVIEKALDLSKKAVEDVDSELGRFKAAASTAREQLEEIALIADKKLGKDKAQIFEAHISMLSDPEFTGAIEREIKKSAVNAEYALGNIVDMYVGIFEQMDNEYMKERAADVRDVGKRLANILLGFEMPSLSVLKEECIIVAKDLGPSDTAQMDREKVLAFVTEIGGRTSHSAIMARTLEIPAVVGISSEIEIVRSGDMLIVDGEKGLIIVNPDDETKREYESQKMEQQAAKEELLKLRGLEAVTLDGKHIEIAGNIGSPKDTEKVLYNGGEGVGLFRTEFLYMDRSSLPDEETQFKAYKEAVQNMGGRPIIIRTLDIGGDKKLPYLPIPHEENPFLGFRAIRLCLKEKDIFRTQLRAILRAGAFGNIRIMFPMISNLSELREAKATLEEARIELGNRGTDFKEDMEIGIMIEIPSAAVISDILAKEVDFFSIGTNDLIQYATAVDRMNEKVSDLYEPFHPGVVRLIKLVIDNAHREGKWVGMCGEMAGDTRAIPMLLGLGLDEFSMSASSILKAKKLVRNCNLEELKHKAQSVLKASTAEEIKGIAEALIK